MTSTNLCQCHCGTRIDVDEQLLQERQMWKQKYHCLQKQFKADIETLKQNIYAECSNIMQQQFSQREADHNRIVNQKNVQIKDLISRVVSLESQIKVMSRQKQLIEQRSTQVQAENSQKDELINLLKNKSAKGIREWQLKHEQQLANLKKRMTAAHKEDLEKIQLDREHLRHKVKEFEQKYQRIIPEVEKIKNNLAAKTAQNEQLEAKIEKMIKKYEQKIADLKEEISDLQKIHSSYPKHIKNLQNQKEELERQLQKCKKITKQVKVEPVYIDRPVEVQKVVEKIVQVEKVVKKFIDDPNSPKVAQLQQQNNHLKQQMNNVLSEIKQMQQQYTKVVNDYEQNMKIYEQNTVKYKREREDLAQKIIEQTKQIQMMENFIEKMTQRGGGGQKQSHGDSEKIVVHVKQDGTYKKTVQKLPTPKSDVGSGNRKKR